MPNPPIHDPEPDPPINPHWPFATPQTPQTELNEAALEEAIRYIEEVAVSQDSLLTERSTNTMADTHKQYPEPRLENSRCFSHHSGGWSLGCVMIEVEVCSGFPRSFRHFKMGRGFYAEASSWSMSEALRKVESGDWVEITEKARGPEIHVPSLFDSPRPSAFRLAQWAGPTDMHQGIGTLFDPAPVNEILHPVANIEQRRRAERFHQAWSYHHDRMQGNINSGNWGPSFRWMNYSKAGIMESIRANRETADERRQWMKFPNRKSSDPKALFKAWYEKLAKTPDDGSNLSEWVNRLWHYHAGAKAVIDANRIAITKLRHGEWVNPHFTTLNWYKPIKWHFVHVSKKDPTKIAYAKDWRAIFSLTDPSVTDSTNAFTVTSPGKYLKKYFGSVLTDDQIRDISAETIAEALPPVLHIARTEAEIIKAIAEGPTESCMANGYHGGRQAYDWFNSPMHPAAAYAGSGDFEVLYVIKGGEITARGIANAKTKKVARIYGDSIRLQAAMAPAGYEQETRALVGCRLRKIVFGDNDDRVVMPYVDAGIGSGGGSLYADFFNDGEGQWLRTCISDGDVNTYDGYNNRGYACICGENGGKTCACCGNRTDSDDLTYIDTDEISVCQSCYDDDYCYGIIDRNGETGRMRQSESVYCRSDQETYLNSIAEYYDIYEVAVGSSRYRGKFYNENDLRMTDEGWAHTSDCTELDSQWYDDGDEWVLDENAVETYDGCMIHTNDVRECAITDRTYHYKQLIKIKTFGIDGKFYDNNWICLDAFTDSPERFSVLYRVPLMKPYLMFDSKVGTPIDQINWEDMAEPMEFSNVFFGDDVSDSDLHDELIAAYDNADHPEEEEERIAA